jgi:hypothetical protein
MAGPPGKQAWSQPRLPSAGRIERLYIRRAKPVAYGHTYTVLQ